MEARLAQVKNLVKERWARVDAKKQENNVLAMRVEHLKVQLQHVLFNKAKRDAMEIQEQQDHLDDEIHADALENEIEVVKDQEFKLQQQQVTIDVQLQHLQHAFQRETMKRSRIWTEITTDKSTLVEMHQAKHHQVSLKRAQEQHKLQQLQAECEQMEVCIAEQKSMKQRMGRQLKQLEQRKRLLDAELAEACDFNESLKKRLRVEKTRQR